MLPPPDALRLARVLTRGWSRPESAPGTRRLWSRLDAAFAEARRIHRALAARYDLPLTTAALRGELARHLLDLARRAEELVEAARPPIPPLDRGHWIAEIHQLESEFSEVAVRWTDRCSASKPKRSRSRGSTSVRSRSSSVGRPGIRAAGAGPSPWWRCNRIPPAVATRSCIRTSTGRGCARAKPPTRFARHSTAAGSSTRSCSFDPSSAPTTRAPPMCCSTGGTASGAATAGPAAGPVRRPTARPATPISATTVPTPVRTARTPAVRDASNPATPAANAAVRLSAFRCGPHAVHRLPDDLLRLRGPRRAERTGRRSLPELRSDRILRGDSMRIDRLTAPLVFTPRAWLKLQFLCHAGPTEVAGFGLSDPDDPLRLDDVLVVRQCGTAVTVAFDDTAVADLFDRMTDAGIPPARFARVWLHTHPGASVEPSPTDEATFERVFGGCDWAVMAILGRTGRTSARIRFHAGPGGAAEIPTRVDWAAWPDAARDGLDDRLGDWRRECETLIERVAPAVRSGDPFADLFQHPFPRHSGGHHAWF